MAADAANAGVVEEVLNRKCKVSAGKRGFDGAEDRNKRVIFRKM